MNQSIIKSFSNEDLSDSDGDFLNIVEAISKNTVSYPQKDFPTYGISDSDEEIVTTRSGLFYIHIY